MKFGAIDPLRVVHIFDYDTGVCLGFPSSAPIGCLEEPLKTRRTADKSGSLASERGPTASLPSAEGVDGRPNANKEPGARRLSIPLPTLSLSEKEREPAC